MFSCFWGLSSYQPRVYRLSLIADGSGSTYHKTPMAEGQSTLEMAISQKNIVCLNSSSHVVVDIDLLDADVCKGHGEAECAGPEMIWE